MDIKALGAKLVECRGRSGLSQDALALKSGVARNLISSLELGRGNPTVDTLDALAAALDIPISAFFTKKMTVRELAGVPKKTGKPSRAPTRPGLAPPGVDEAFLLLSRYKDLSPLRKALVAVLVFDDIRYIGHDPEMSQALEEFLKAST